jgi:hypothetical protein
VALTQPIRRRLSATLLALLATLALAAVGAGRAGAAQTDVTVSSTPVTRPLPTGFVGMAITYSALAQWMSTAGPVDPVLVQLIRNLTPTGRPWLRIGGESADRSWWPIAGFRKPLGITYDLGTSWTTEAHQLAHTLNAELMMGLELEADKPEIDKVEARQLLSHIGRHYIQSFQIGNEPELYKAIPWYKILHGHPVVWYSPVGKPVYARPRTYGSPQFMSEFASILKVLPKYPIAGPETNIPSWTQAFLPDLKPAGPVNTLTTHAYGVNNCDKDKQSAAYPSIPNLLSLHASRDLLRDMAPYIAEIHQRGGHYRIDEMGAVTCTGPEGVSDSMATALWVIDALFDAARQGVDGVNLHTTYARINNLFSLRAAGGRWQASVSPLYYGALMFARADPAGSRQLNVSDGTVGPVRVWATRGGGKIRVEIIDDGLKAGSTVRLRLQGAAASGTLERLVAAGGRGAYSTSGVSLGGRSFGTTTTGKLGAPQLSTVKRRGGTFAVSMPKGSAALLTIDAR